jgi:hypothetical protein
LQLKLINLVRSKKENVLMPGPESLEKHHSHSTLAEVVKGFETCTGAHKADNVLCIKNTITQPTVCNTGVSNRSMYMVALYFKIKLKVRVPLLGKIFQQSDSGKMLTLGITLI